MWNLAVKPRFSDCTVLVVEDEPLIANEMSAALQVLGFGNVVVAHCIRSAAGPIEKPTSREDVESYFKNIYDWTVMHRFAAE